MPAPPPTSPWLYLGFTAGVLALAGAELLLSARRPEPPTVRRAAIWSAVWVGAALGFGGWLGHVRGHEDALAYGAAYLTEESLSLDNMIVFVTIFAYFGIPTAFQQRVLLWGILGAIVMRFLFIFAGVGLLNRFYWLVYLFGALLIYTGLKMAFQREESLDPGANPALKVLRRFLPMTHEANDQNFFVRINGALHATPLFATLLVVEFSDLIFAADSIPAVLAVSRDTFVVYTSNVFAIMGLRALYFLLANLMGLFRFLKVGISVILIFVGAKMAGGLWFHIPISVSLCVIAGILCASIAASLLAGPRSRPQDLPAQDQ